MKRITLLACLLSLLAATGARAATIQLLPATTSVAPGDTVSIDVVISGLGMSVVGDYDLDLAFDPAVLSFVSSSVSGALGDVAAGEAADFSLGLTAPGSVNLAVVSFLSEIELDALQTEPFALATLLFQVGPLAPGAQTDVEITTVYALGDGSGAPISVGAATAATLSRQASPGGNIPEPAMLLLVGTGAAASLLRRLKRAPGATK